MTKEPVLIALDGPVSAGKSSLADEVARRLDILHLDTGAMYRAVGLAAIRQGIDPREEQPVCGMLIRGEALVDIRFEKGRQQTLLNGKPVDADIRSQEAGSAASAVSRYPAVRKYLVARQQELAGKMSMIVDGRDIGTVVLPDARAKIFLSASPEVRALRRHRQLQKKGADVSFEDVLRELIARDKQDRERAADPLRQADDAVLLDTSELDFKESVEAILAIVKEAYDI